MYSIIVCVLITFTLTQMISNRRRRRLVRLICGIFLIISIFRPLVQIDWTTWWDIADLRQFSADSYIADGKKTALQAQEIIIKDAFETYILDKAKNLGAEITVDFTLNEDLLPVFAEIQTEADPSVQKQLQDILTADLGIPKERQTWISCQESSIS